MKKHMQVLSFLLIIFSANPAFADIGLPMLAVTWPPMLLALIPVIFIEASVLLKMLPIPKKLALRCSIISNVISTIIGIPLTWLCLVVLEVSTVGDGVLGLDSWWNTLQSVIFQAPWLIPYEETWVIPAAAMVLLIPFFFISWYVEYLISARILRKSINLEHKLIRKSVFIGNLLTYSMLEVFAFIFFICAFFWDKI